MRKLQAFLNAIESFKGLFSVSWLLLLIPGGGIVAALAGGASAIAKAAGNVVKAFFDGITISIANPVVFLIIGSAFVGGLWQGVEWDKHKVEAARSQSRTQLARIETSINERVSEGVRESLRAEARLAPTPETPAELKKLCNASASCRSRGLK
jgi:hypothetical protein